MPSIKKDFIDDDAQKKFKDFILKEKERLWEEERLKEKEKRDNLFEERIKKHKEEVLDSQAYKQASQYRSEVIGSFQMALQVIPFVTSRDFSLFKESACIFGCTDLFASVTSIDIISREAMLNTPKRELRYMLEATIKYVAVDELCNGQTLEDKMNYFYTKIPRSSISPIDKIEGLPKDMVADTKELYSLLSQFTHPSKLQITEYKLQAKRDMIGFITHKELDSFNRLLFRTLDIIIYLLLRALGPFIVIDAFDILDDYEKWKFPKGKHTSGLYMAYKRSR